MTAQQPTKTTDLVGNHSDHREASRVSTADNKARREQREAAQKQAADEFHQAREAQAKLNAEKMEAEAKLKPTPTPEEIAMAMAGHNKDIKEPSGAPLQNPNHPVLNAAQQIEVGRKMESAQPVPDNQTPKQQAEADRNSTGAKK